MSDVLLDLLFYSHRCRQILITGPDGAAINAALDTKGTIAIRTRIGNANRQFINFSP